MEPDQYDAWYRTPRGRWIGEREYRLLRSMLAPAAGATIVEVGCGTGFFTRRFAQDGGRLVGIDRDPDMIRFAQNHQIADECYETADAGMLPFADQAFDHAVAITSLCFVPDQAKALREMVRVARHRIALGLLNRHSLLYWRKGRHGGSGAYRGAYWHTPGDVAKLLAALPVSQLVIRSTIHFPAAGTWSHGLEPWLERYSLLGGFLAVVADIRR